MFSTRDRQPLIADPAKLHAYLVGVIKRLGAACYEAGGTRDHVHLLCGFPPSVAIASLVGETKRVSSIWMRSENPGFAWQNGYAAFSVDTTSFDAVRAYIQNQEEHHRLVDPRQELLDLLAEFGIEPDMRYFV